MVSRLLMNLMCTFSRSSTSDFNGSLWPRNDDVSFAPRGVAPVPRKRVPALSQEKMRMGGTSREACGGVSHDYGPKALFIADLTQEDMGFTSIDDLDAGHDR